LQKKDKTILRDYNGVFDLGMETTEYKGKSKTQHKICLMFEIDERLKTGEFQGKRYLKSKKYTLSLNEKSNLRKDLEAWRNKAFTEQELQGFDVEVLEDKHCMVTILNEDSNNGKTYTNIKSLASVPKGLQLITRELEKGYCPEWIKSFQIERNVITSEPSDPWEKTDESIPF
jgi:hypothetical protein